MKPKSTQTVKNVKGRWETTRFSHCPIHTDTQGRPRKVSRFIAPTEDGWIFECKPENGAAHRFYAQPAKNAPRGAEEANAWFKAEVERVSREPTRSQS